VSYNTFATSLGSTIKLYLAETIRILLFTLLGDCITSNFGDFVIAGLRRICLHTGHFQPGFRETPGFRELLPRVSQLASKNNPACEITPDNVVEMLSLIKNKKKTY